MRLYYAYYNQLVPIEMAKTKAFYNTQAKKKAVNVSINRDLVKRARALNINLSQTLEHRLLELLRQKERELWLKQNQEAIAEYNQRVEKQCTFSDRLRTF